MAELAKCTNTEPHDAHQLVDGMFTIACLGVVDPVALAPYYEVIDNYCDEVHTAAGVPADLVADMSRLRAEGRLNTPG